MKQLLTDGNPRVDRLLDTNGDGTGTKNANIDGSVTPVLFCINPPASGQIVLQRMLVEIEDGTGFRAERYASLAAALVNGIEVGIFRVSDGVQLIDYLDADPIKSNAGWARHMFDVDVKTWGPGNEVLVARWTFSRSGTSTLLKAGDDACFGVRVSDDLLGIVGHFFLVQGYVRYH